MLFETGGSVEAVSFTNEKITLGGEDYSPARPEALDAYYARDHEGFLSGDIYQLQTEMPFTDFDIASVRLEEQENYSSGVTVVNSTDPDYISRIMRALNQAVVRRFEQGENPGMFVGVGGNNYICTFTMQDGSTWSINPRGTATVTPQSGIPEDILGLQLDYNEAFGLLLDKNDALPQLAADIGGVSPTVYEIAYQTEKTQKSRTDVVPVDMHFDSDEDLPPGESYTCRLVWNGGQSSPESVTATLYRAPSRKNSR